jgi:hypothetical protein
MIKQEVTVTLMMFTRYLKRFYDTYTPKQQKRKDFVWDYWIR